MTASPASSARPPWPRATCGTSALGCDDAMSDLRADNTRVDVPGVTDTEVGDEDSYYEVEVTLDDGSQVDVQLDEGFNVVGGETDGAGEDDGPGDD